MSSSRFCVLFLCVLISMSIALVGCGGSNKSQKFGRVANTPAKASAIEGGENNLKQVGYASHNPHDFLAQTSQKKSGAAPLAKISHAEKTERKIIYTANIHVVLNDLDKMDLDKAILKLTELIQTHNGYIASSDVSGETGSQRTGTWTIRLPVDQFKIFRKALLKFGYPQQNSLSSNDVTQKYYSLESRMRNTEATEKRLLKHLETSKETKDTLAIEKELDRVRNSIEQMKGQLRMWQSLSALTTVNLTLVENQNYKPPQEPTFATRISLTFDASWKALTMFGKGLVLFVVLMTPWLPVLAVIFGPTWWIIRRSRKRQTSVDSLKT